MNETKMKVFKKSFWIWFMIQLSKASFEDESLEKFWGMMKKAYPKVAEKPLTLLTAVFPPLILVSQHFQMLLQL